MYIMHRLTIYSDKIFRYMVVFYIFIYKMKYKPQIYTKMQKKNKIPKTEKKTFKNATD